MHSTKTVVISVGGSLIVPQSGIDTGFLKKLKNFLEKNIASGYQFVIITGGGATARNYQNASQKVAPTEREDLDWLGVHSTRLNGHLMRTILRKHAYPIVIKNAYELRKAPTNFKILIGAGWQPGATTDYRAVQFAKQFKIGKVVNLSDIDYVYDKDPKKYKDAKPIKEMTWKEFKKFVPENLTPGVHTPFDPKATKEAEKLKLEVVMLNGKKLQELQKYLDGKKFKGTKIA